MKIREVLDLVRVELNSDNEAKLLVSFYLNCSLSDLFLLADNEIDNAVLDEIFFAKQRRINGEPLQYILGETEFYGLKILVGDGVLIPRPETEILVDLARENYPKSDCGILDLCTGSGCVILALAKNLPTVKRFEASDISEEALYWARKNAAQHQQKISFFCGDLFSNISPKAEDKFSLIVTNPPYIGFSEEADLKNEVKNFEPQNALFAEDCGLEIIKKIAEESAKYLVKDGLLICEIGAEQGFVISFFKKFFGEVIVKKDLVGRDRFIFARNPLLLN